jgi:hypothetical protein
LPALPAHQLARIVLLTRHRAKLAIFEFLRTNRRGALDVGYHEQIPNDGGAGYDYQVAPAPVNGGPGFVPFSHHFPRGFSKRYARELCKLAGPHGQNLDAANNDQIQGFMLMNCIARGFRDFPQWMRTRFAQTSVPRLHVQRYFSVTQQFATTRELEEWVTRVEVRAGKPIDEILEPCYHASGIAPNQNNLYFSEEGLLVGVQNHVEAIRQGRIAADPNWDDADSVDSALVADYLQADMYDPDPPIPAAVAVNGGANAAEDEIPHDVGGGAPGDADAQWDAWLDNDDAPLGAAPDAAPGAIIGSPSLEHPDFGTMLRTGGAMLLRSGLDAMHYAVVSPEGLRRLAPKRLFDDEDHNDGEEPPSKKRRVAVGCGVALAAAAGIMMSAGK